jgi:hypothetical protein
VAKSLRRRLQQQTSERRRFDRERLLRNWAEWCSLEVTRQAVLPFTALLVLSLVAGWWLGSRQQPVCHQVIVQPGVSRTP